jgi:hypothetical protein
MRVLIALASLLAVAAFAPMGRTAARNSAISMDIGLIGASAPVGFFDPLGLSKGKSEETLAWYRAAELKHGRVCMLASVGIWIQGAPEQGWIPGYITKDTNALAAVSEIYAKAPGALWQILLAIAAVEVLNTSIESKGGRPGDFGWDPANLRPKDEDKLDELQLKELKNGRLAMLGAAGMLYQNALTGQGVFEQIAAGHLSPFNDGQGAF